MDKRLIIENDRIQILAKTWNCLNIALKKESLCMAQNSDKMKGPLI